MKDKKRFVCQQCGAVVPKWMGRCPECESWNSIVEEILHPAEKSVRAWKKPELLDEVEYSEEERISTSFKELDRVLGGGIVPGSLVLIGGDPGIGKSTLMLQACSNISHQEKVLYVSGEESAKQLKLRGSRLGISGGRLYIMAENDIDAIEAEIRDMKPTVVIIDSIQTIYCQNMESGPGSVSQIRESTLRLLKISKDMGTAIFIVGHVTKEGNLAGPRLLEHMVDCVLYFEGERYHSYRILRAVKNRFGSTNEIGIFEMKEKGLQEVDSPSRYLLSGKPKGSAGSAVTCVLEGTRPLLVEVQALVAGTSFNIPRRQTSGVDYNRAALLVAVLEKKLGYSMSHDDVYINVAGGIKIEEPAADLSVEVAVASSFKNRPVRENVVIIGEVGLAGEVRSASFIEKRVQEAAKLGFSEALVPCENVKELEGLKIKIRGVKTVREAVEAALN